MEKIRVLIQQPILPPYRLAVFAALSKHPQLDVTFAYGTELKGRPLDSIVNPPGLDVRTFNNVAWGEGPKIMGQPKIFKIIKEVKPDVALFALNPRNVTSLIATRKLKKADVPIVYWGHGIRPSGKYKSFYVNEVNGAQATLLYYPQGKEELVDLGVPPEKLFVAWNSIETEAISKLAEPYTPDRNGIICVGRLIPPKKVDLLVKAFDYAVKNFNLDAELIIIGDGPESEKVRELVNLSPFSNKIRMTGTIWNQEELAPYFNKAYIAVSAGQVGLSAIHCMAYGVPMLCADNEPHSPEIMALKENENSVFFKADSIEDLAKNLYELKQNPQLLSHLSNNAFTYIHQNFSAQKMADNIARAIIYAHENRK